MSMRIGFNQSFGVNTVQSPIAVNRKLFNINFGSQLKADTFESTTVNKFVSEGYIKKAISSNPKIKQICKNFNPEMNLNMAQLKAVLDGHSTDTKNISLGIVENLPASYRNKVDTEKLSNAAYLHDVGKVLIPPEVLDKPGKLDKDEFETMKAHAELSYEILKNSGIDKETLYLVRNHHQNLQKNGYPPVEKDFEATVGLQVLATADKYSALTEKRVYREPLTPKQALTIIHREVEDEKLDPTVFKALVNWVKAKEEASETEGQTTKTTANN